MFLVWVEAVVEVVVVAVVALTVVVVVVAVWADLVELPSPSTPDPSRGSTMSSGWPNSLSTTGEASCFLLDWTMLMVTRKTSRVFTMRGLTVQAAADLKFLLSGRDGQPDRMVSIVDYYKEIYNVQVTKPRLVSVSQAWPEWMLMTSLVSPTVRGTTFPSSSSTLPSSTVNSQTLDSSGQSLSVGIPMMRLTADQTAEMIKVAAKPPPERAQMSKLPRLYTFEITS